MDIVVGVDGSDGSKAALRWAVDEAAVRGCPVVAVLAYGFYAHPRSGAGPRMPWTDAGEPSRSRRRRSMNTPNIGRDLVPWHLVETLLRPTALVNAGRAAADIAQTVLERRNLTDGLDRGAGLAGQRQLVELTREECLRLLAARRIGRLAFIQRAGVPLILPVNYVFADDAVLIRSGPGPKMQAAERGDLVSFETDDIDEESRSGWSVVVTGRASRVRGESRSDEPQPQPWAPGPRCHLIRVPASRISGRWLFPEDDDDTASD